MRNSEAVHVSQSVAQRFVVLRSEPALVRDMLCRTCTMSHIKEAALLDKLPSAAKLSQTLSYESEVRTQQSLEARHRGPPYRSSTPTYSVAVSGSEATIYKYIANLEVWQGALWKARDTMCHLRVLSDSLSLPPTAYMSATGGIVTK